MRKLLPAIAIVIIALTSIAAELPVAHAIVWADPDATAPTEQRGAFKHVGRLRYTRFRVFGGSCIWIGDRWVLTARHAVANWQPTSLKVEFSAVEKKNYAVKAIHLPADKKLDLALIELAEAPTMENPIPLRLEKPSANELIAIGGYGRFGAAGAAAGMNRFHHGKNRIDSVSKSTAKFSMNRPPEGESLEALPAIMDSGSPVLITVDGKQQLAGIVIRVSNGSSPGHGDRATFTRVDNQREWIRKIRKE